MTIGILVIAFGWLLIGLALKSLNKTHAFRGYVAAGLLGLFGAVLMLHGLFFASTGHWLPFLTSANRSSENIRIEAVVIAELKLSDIQREIFRADFVECANHPALNQRPWVTTGEA